MPQLANILPRPPAATQPPPNSSCLSRPSPAPIGSAPIAKQRPGFTACPRWLDLAIAEHTTNAYLRGQTVRLAILLFDRADNHTGATRTLTYPQLARLLDISADSVARAVGILRVIGACTTAHVYVERRRIGMRYLMRRAVTKTAGQRSQDLSLRTSTSTKSSSATSAPPTPTPTTTACPITETPWLFDVPVMAEKGEACPRCQCQPPQPEVLELAPELAPVPQRELPLEPDRPTAPRPSDGQLRLPVYQLLDRQPVLSDEALLAAVEPIIAARYPGARVSAERLTRQLRIVRQRHDPDYAEKQHRRDQTARRTTTTAGLSATYARRDVVRQAYPEFAGVPTAVLWRLAEAEQAGDQEAAGYWRERCARSAEGVQDDAPTGTNG